jgi:hypothetical protein
MIVGGRIKLIVILILLIGGCFFARAKVFTAESIQNLNVYLEVTTTTEEEEPGGGGGGLVDNYPPVISNVSSTVNYTTSMVSWTATDISTIQYCNFYYGLTESYGSSAASANSLSDYQVNLSGLEMGTLYYFMISCLDSFGNLGTYTGDFTTLSTEFENALILLAKPEKRVAKSGGNYDMGATLRLYDSVSGDLAYSGDVNFDANGMAAIYDAGISTGNYTAMLKGEAHLGKRITNVEIANDASTTIDFTIDDNFYLYAGDVQGTGLKDNFIDILDVSKEDTEFNIYQKIYDLNRDGAVDVLDISIILTNFNTQGDAL